MTTPTRSTMTALCRIVEEEQLRDDHHSIGQVLDLMENWRYESEQVTAALRWLMQDNQVTTSLFIGPAIELLSKRAAEAALEESRELTR